MVPSHDVASDGVGLPVVAHLTSRRVPSNGAQSSRQAPGSAGQTRPDVRSSP